MSEMQVFDKHLHKLTPGPQRPQTIFFEENKHEELIGRRDIELCSDLRELAKSLTGVSLCGRW